MPLSAPLPSHITHNGGIKLPSHPAYLFLIDCQRQGCEARRAVSCLCGLIVGQNRSWWDLTVALVCHRSRQCNRKSQPSGRYRPYLATGGLQLLSDKEELEGLIPADWCREGWTLLQVNDSTWWGVIRTKGSRFHCSYCCWEELLTIKGASFSLQLSQACVWMLLCFHFMQV